MHRLACIVSIVIFGLPGPGSAAAETGVIIMTFDELRRLNPREIGSWPVLPKLCALLLLVIIWLVIAVRLIISRG